MKETIPVTDAESATAEFTAPAVRTPTEIHLLLTVTDAGAPPLTRYARVIVTVSP